MTVAVRMSGDEVKRMSVCLLGGCSFLVKDYLGCGALTRDDCYFRRGNEPYVALHEGGLLCGSNPSFFFLKGKNSDAIGLPEVPLQVRARVRASTVVYLADA